MNTPHPAVRRALAALQAANLAALKAGEGRGNSNERMAQILDEALGYSELVEALKVMLEEPWVYDLSRPKRWAQEQARAALAKASPEEDPKCARCGEPGEE